MRRKSPGPISRRIRCSPHGSRLSPAPAAGARALDIGCGLGDNAAAIAGEGLAHHRVRPVAARDRLGAVALSATWTSSPPTCSAPPADWNGAFDLVHECYTLQALPDAPRAEAIAQIARFVGAGGRLVLIARARNDSGPAAGPPWPLTRDEVMSFAAHGLAAEAVEQLADPTDGKPHWRAVFRRS